MPLAELGRPLLFAAAFIAYAFCWCVFWFGLDGKFQADLWGAAFGLAAMTAVIRSAFHPRAGFLPLFAVLFLFVVMMLDVDFAGLKRGALQYASVGALVGIVLAAELIVVLGGYTFAPQLGTEIARPTPPISERHNTAALVSSASMMRQLRG